MTAPVIGDTPIVSLEVGDLVLEHLNAMVLATDEHDVRPVPVRFKVKVAVVDLGDRHGGDAFLSHQLADEIGGDHEQQHGVDPPQPELAHAMTGAHPEGGGDHDRGHHCGEDRKVDIAQGITREIRRAPSSHDGADGGNRAGH